MRRTLATLLLASTAALGLGFAAPASAVCGGGQPGEPCHCPDLRIKDTRILYC